MKVNKYLLSKCWTDSKKIVTAPVRWKKSDWQKFSLFTVTTGAMMFTDEPILDFMQDHRSPVLDKVSKYGLEPFGNYYNLAACSGFLLYGLLSDNPKSKSTGILAFESLALASLFVRIPKILFGRTRPDDWQQPSPFDFKGPFHGTSFPSGHTTAVFAVASVIANQYSDTGWVPILSYSVATLTGLSRIYDNRHWASDVFLGAVIGTAIGNMVCQNNKDRKLTIIPYKTNSTYGVKLALTL